MGGFTTGYVFGGAPPTRFGADLLLQKSFPGTVLNSQETLGEYVAIREINGSLWSMINADWNGTGFQQINPALTSQAYALQATGGFCTYSAPAGSPTPFTWNVNFCVGSGATLSRALPIFLSAAFTPSVTGLDTGSIRPVIVNPFILSPFPATIAFQCVAIYLRTETAASASATSISIQRYTGTSAFADSNMLNATPIILPSGDPREILVGPSGISAPAVNSGDKLAVYYNSIGTGAANMTVYVLLSAVF